MARALSAAMLAAIVTGDLRPVFFYEGEFTGGWLRLFSGYGTMSWNGYTWTGDAGMMQITDIQEVSELQAINFTVSLNGEMPAVISAALSQVRRGKPGSVWLGLLDSSGALLADPFLCFKGRADKPSIIPDPSHATVSVAYESRLIDGARRRERRYTSEDQQIDHPGDLGFDYVPSLQDAVFTWGRR
jgi:hypothetical protein